MTQQRWGWLVGLLLAMLSPTLVGAATYYVSKAGTSNDSNNGTSPATAWLTIQKAANTAVAGDVVNIGAGTFDERITFANSGTAGSRITYQGTRGGGGSWDTFIRGDTPPGGAWVAATEIGAGVYRQNLGYTPWAMSSNNLGIWRLGNHTWSGNAATWLSKAPNSTQSTAMGTIPFWDGIEALFGVNGSTTYIRFRNQANPSTMNVRAAPAGATVTLNARNYITLKDLKIGGGEYGVWFTGGSTGGTLDSCYIVHGQNAVFLQTSTAITIKNSTLTYDGIGFVNHTPGDWTNEGGAPTIVNRHLYDFNKFEIGNTETNDSRIHLYNNPAGSIIEDNLIERSVAGITWHGTSSNTIVRNNTVRYHADNCFYFNGDNSSGTVHGNLVYDCDHGMRFESVENPLQFSIYANRFFQHYYSALSGGKHIFISPRPSFPGSNFLRIYHNSFAGGGWAVDNGCGTYPFVHMRNNFVSTRGISSCGTSYGTVLNNMSSTIWFNNTIPSFILPAGNPGINTAPSLIATGWTGMTSGYYVDGLPDHGAIQSGGGGDATAPTVFITAPVPPITVSGTSVSVTANASDNVAVVGVQFRLDGSNLGAEDTSSPYGITWNTTTATDGGHTLTAVARDAAGNTTTSSGVVVTVDNVAGDAEVPTVAITAPSNGATVSGTTVAVTANASDNVGVVGVQFKLDGANLGAEDTTSTYGITWNTTLVANGSHTLTAVARDAAGNTTTSSGIAVTVDNGAGDTTPPVVTMTAPAQGAEVSGTSVGLAATASDNVGVAGVKFLLDGEEIGWEQCCSSNNIVWDSTTTTNGSHELSAIARDAAGNTTVATARTVTVANAVEDNGFPTVEITTPLNESMVSGQSVEVAATASDNVGVVGVQFTLDGSNLEAEDTTEPYSIVWNTALTSDGSHALRAVARDAAGNSTTSTASNVVVRNNPQGISIVGNATIVFLGNPLNVTFDVSAVVVLGNPISVSINANVVPPFPNNPSGVGLGAEGTPGFLGNPTGVSITPP